MQTYHAVLYIHLVSLLLATGAAAVTHLSDLELRRAQTLGEAGRAGLRIKAAARAFPPAVVGLLGSGIYMAHDAGWGWSSAWIVGGLVGLALIVGVGDALNARAGKRLGAAIGGALARGGDGPLTDEVRALLDEPLTKAAAILPTALMLGVVYLMTVKPGPLGCALGLAIPVAAAAVVGPRLLAVPRERVEAAGAPETV